MRVRLRWGLFCAFFALALAGTAEAQWRFGSLSTTTAYGFESSDSSAASPWTTSPSPASNEAYFDPYEACAEEARIESVSFATPDEDDLLVRGDEPWVAGEELFVDLTVSRCTRVSAFRYDDVELWQTDGGVDGRSYGVRLVSTRTRDETSEIRLALTHAHLGHGLRKRVLLDVTQPKTGRVSTRLLHVNWVAAVNEDPEITILEEDVHNALLGSLYETFGDDERAPLDEDGSWFIKNPRLDPCEGHPALDSGCLRAEIVEDLGVRFTVEMELELAYFCNPVIRASGAVAYVPTGDGFEPEWVEDLELDVNVPALCKLITLIVPAVIAEEVAEAYAIDLVEAEITPLLDQDIDCGESCGFAGMPTYLDGEIRVPIAPVLPRVTIDVPYRAKRPDDDDWGRNLFQAADQHVLLLPSGDALTCYEQSDSFQGCTAYRTSSAGLENFRSDSPTVPDPWVFANGRWGYHPFRQALRDRMILPDRFLENLPAPASPVAAQLARTVGSPFIREVSSACRMPAPVVDRAIGFSPNDRWDRSLGTLDRRVTMVFLDGLPEASVRQIPLCPQAGDTVQREVSTFSSTAAGTLAQP